MTPLTAVFKILLQNEASPFLRQKNLRKYSLEFAQTNIFRDYNVCWFFSDIMGFALSSFIKNRDNINFLIFHNWNSHYDMNLWTTTFHLLFCVAKFLFQTCVNLVCLSNITVVTLYRRLFLFEIISMCKNQKTTVECVLFSVFY